MGKLRALKLGIKKGVQHTIEYGQRTTLSKAIDYTVSRMKCTTCGHASRSHTERRSLYVGIQDEDIFKLLKATFVQTVPPGMDECMVYFCSDCQKETEK